MASKNKGEVSELYTLIYILGNGVVPLVDGRLRCLGRELNFKAVYRKEGAVRTAGVKTEVSNQYVLDADKDLIFINYLGNRVGQVSKKLLRQKASETLRLVQDNGAVDDNNPLILAILKLLHTQALSAKASDKSDFSGDVTTEGVPGVQHLGFSIKSNLGSASTLINANKESSAFRFELIKEDKSPTEEEAKDLNASPNALREAIDQGWTLKFVKACGKALNYNLRLMDSLGPEIIASLLLERYYGKTASLPITRLIERISQDERSRLYPAVESFGETPEERKAVLEFKVRNILLGFATGATVGIRWDGRDDANGGFIVVKKNGEIVCLELFTREAVGRYLLDWTFFEEPSRKRHGHNKVLIEDGRGYIDLQLQVRFRQS